MVVRRRYYYWLLKAYFKRWGKIIIASVFFGAVMFSLLFFLASYFFLPKVSDSVERIGIAGAIRPSKLPDSILMLVSFGLTQVTNTSEVKPGAATTWDVKDDGKTYVFHLRKDLRLHDGKKFTAYDVPIAFQDAEKKAIDDYTVEYKLKNVFAPFLAIVSKPILIDNKGLGAYEIKKISQEAGYVKSVELQHVKTHAKKIFYVYPTQEALKTAFELGEIDRIEGLSGTLAIHNSYKNWKNVEVSQETNYSKLVTLFFNTSDDTLSNKKLRQALLYSLPLKFSGGERSYSYLPTSSIYYAITPNQGIYDLELSKSLIESSGSAQLKIEISSSTDLIDIAKEVASAWGELGITTEIKEVNGIPQDFQVFLYTMNVPMDPDMYQLWHSGQPDNLSHYQNVRIDKLLEDGRQTINLDERIKIYADLQKYIIDDTPAAFLYFPYSFTVVRN